MEQAGRGGSATDGRPAGRSWGDPPNRDAARALVADEAMILNGAVAWPNTAPGQGLGFALSRASRAAEFASGGRSCFGATSGAPWASCKPLRRLPGRAASQWRSPLSALSDLACRALWSRPPLRFRRYGEFFLVGPSRHLAAPFCFRRGAVGEGTGPGAEGWLPTS